MSRFARDPRGATAIEYAMVASIISIVVFASVQNLGTTLTSFFNSLAGYL
ncbi:MAG TPA: Flp family type IVb pilin [Rhizomicrobium sp.]|nr:Flp family type IVb pilin [Rhizomicrobium sp.]